MSSPSIPQDKLNPKVKDLGLLVKLLEQKTPDGDLSLNTDWFADLATNLKQIPRDPTDLLNLLRDYLGDPTHTTTDQEWYALNWKDAPSGVYIVLPLKAAADPASIIGVGLWHQFTEEPSIIASAYFPLFSLSSSADPAFVTGTDGNPLKLVLDITSKDTFTVGDFSFDEFKFEADIYFAAQSPPNLKISFLNKTDPRTVSTLSDLQSQSVTSWINFVIGTTTVTGWLNNVIPSTKTKIGDVLVDLELLQMSGTSYALGGLHEFESETPAQIAEKLTGEALKNLAASESPVLPLGKGGIFIVGAQVEGAASGVKDYGLRLQVPDIQVSGAKEKAADGGSGKAVGDAVEGDPPPSSDAPAQNSPKLVLQIGKWLTGDTDTDNWASRADAQTDAGKPGVTILLVRDDQSAPDPLSFHPKLALVSLGLDFTGGNDKPLIDVSGFKLGGFEPRFSLSLDFSDPGNIPWGAALRLDKLGLPLGAGLPGSTSSNPVAQNLLSSGSSGDSSADKDKGTGQEGAGADKAAVNPAFSVALAKVFKPDNPVNFQFYAPDDSLTEKVWLPVQRAFGPLHCQRIGAEGPQPNSDLVLSLLFDGGVVLGGLEVDLLGLSVGIPLSSPGDLHKYHLGLDGLDITYSGGPVEISGGLLKEHVTVDGEDVLEYNGEALIKAASWSIAALGSWASFEGHPSLFIFAFLNAPIGGPAFFFVTGVSAGFGYNRSLTLPAQDQVQNFPFVAGLSDPSKIGGADAGPKQALAALGDSVLPAQGVNWIAAGIQFTSFEIINSNALVVVEFGKHFEIALLGLSRIKLPQAGSNSYAYVELGLEVIIDPEDGVFSATASITPNSFVIDPACHLTGGFAFFIWFGENAHAGDFVLTVGGYHPLFTPHNWYPVEPRLGFNWQVSDQVTIQGSAYFALTPSCVMGGGALDIEFHSGDLAAWFTAHADFLIQWKPFYFLASVGISIGVSYRLHLLFVTVTLKLEIGADMDLWGPPTGGVVHVHLWVVSFTVSFGPDYGTGNDYLGWEDFRTLLPKDNKSQAIPASHATAAMFRSAAATALSQNDAPLPLGNVCQIICNTGLLPHQPVLDRWLVRSDEFNFTVETTFPLTELDLAGPSANPLSKLNPPTLDPTDTDAPTCATTDGYYVGVRSMGISCTTSILTLTVTDNGEPEPVDLQATWLWQLNTRAVPEAMWGQPVSRDATPKPAADTLPGRLVGLSISPKIIPPTGPDAIPMANLSYFPLNEDDDKYLPFPQSPETIQPQASDSSLKTIAGTIAQDSAATSPVANRASIFGALAAFGYDAGTNGDLTTLAAAVNLNYPAEPMLGSPVSL